MVVDPELIERIYEAAALPERWPTVLESIADQIGAFGATVTTRTAHGTVIMPSPRIEQTISDFIAEGWTENPAYAAPLWTDLYPGFCAETRYRSVEEIERLPVHIHFLAPRGLTAAVATVLQGARDDVTYVTLEGLPSHPAAEAAVPWLDTIRPALGRAISLTAQMRAQADAGAVAALDLAGVPAAVVTPDGRLRAVNNRFTRRLAAAADTRAGRIRFADQFAQAKMDTALAAFDQAAGTRSIAIPARDKTPALALHLLPLRRGARDVFGWDGVLILLAEPANASLPGADLLRLLYDLTPAEARLTRHLLEGRALAEAARETGITEGTARIHLKRVFTKTGVQRQSELMRLLLGLGVAA